MNSNDAEIAAGEWLARLDGDDPSPGDLSAFEQWKSADPRHAAAYARLAATWQALDRVQAIRPGSEVPVDNDYLRVPSQRRLWHRPGVLFPLAASVLIALAGLWISRGPGEARSYSTGIGGYQRVILDDQSTLELNTNSEVRVAFTSGLRRVELVRGEASFEVTHDTARPFVVSAGRAAVRAVGTRFDVNRLAGAERTGAGTVEGGVEVIVDEGKVAIGSPSVLEAALDAVPPAIPRVSAGQSAIARGGGVELENLRQGDLARKLAWRNQMLVFDGDSLADVIAQFNRYNKRQLVIADPTLAALRIGGYFRPTNLDAFISVLQSDFGIRVDVDDNRLELAPSAVK